MALPARWGVFELPGRPSPVVIPRELDGPPFVDGMEEVDPFVVGPFGLRGRELLPGGGARRLVVMFSMSFPLTTRLSFDFLRSRVIISVTIVSHILKSKKCRITFSTNIKIEHAANADIDDSKKALVLLLELLLIEDLDGEDTLVRCSPIHSFSFWPRMIVRIVFLTCQSSRSSTGSASS